MLSRLASAAVAFVAEAARMPLRFDGARRACAPPRGADATRMGI